MTRYLFDTGSLTDYINRRTPTVERAEEMAADGHRLGICTPVLGEFRGGLEFSADPSLSESRWQAVRGSITIWPYDHVAAAEYGRIYAELRRLGRPMQQVDMQVAAVAFALGRTVVVSKDSDLRAIPGLNVEDWSVAE